ncbi:phospholipid-transporting ATPase ABCA3-like isoform X2 [Athalia rosae]|uniref:phospholipid-transporting ATPase ABCA3-like isoform X2 n=1 Tax=Athalia rosae TaxID=37344 RepID=UPI002033B4BF|nr:phospholipid-transporting ATPase ABCA3-like isoform X2 [Athalia rosae]
MISEYSNKGEFTKMFEELRILFELLHKYFIVRKRHLICSIVEFVLCVCLVFLIVIIRTNFDVEPTHVNTTTYYPTLSQNDLINNIQRSMLHLYYKPDNNFTRNLMQDVTRCAKLSQTHLFGFDSEDAMLQSFEIQQGKDVLISILAIDFDDNVVGPEQKTFTYTIRSSQPIPDKLFEFGSESFSTASDALIEAIPVVPLQMCLDNGFIARVAPYDSKKPTVFIRKMPYPPYDTINFMEISMQAGIYILGGFIFSATIYLIPTYVSAEKSTGVNTLLKMNGVKSYQNFLSWQVGGMLFSIVPLFAITVLLKLSFASGQKAFYYHSDWCIIWLALFLNSAHLHAFCLHVASYFSKAWLAQSVATSIYAIINVIVYQLETYGKFTFIPYLGLLCPTAATMRIFDELNKRENDLSGAHWDNLFEAAHPSLKVTGSLGFIMLFSIFGVICHFMIAVYLDAVLPSKYGIQKPPLFFLQNFRQNKVCSSYNDISSHGSEGEPKILEPVDKGTLTTGIQLRNLTKCFTCGCFKSHRVNAVRGISLDFYKGQITALLGHNGAGKTTTFSILTGLTAPSSGTVYINGKDVSKDLDVIRSDLGVCPQENTTFPDLTVSEQLQLIGSLKQKDLTREQLVQKVDDLLEKLNLKDKRDVMPEKLSGGQKRRLCLGMALIGNASTLFLDEPTSGMDPETSRETWDMILKYRKQKTIIITTHSMEEADVLGDRIAIMHSGQMKCYGTPMFLKKFYGHDYHEVTLSTSSWCDVDKIQEIVGKNAKLNLSHQGRIVVSIPFTSSLPEILDNIESQKLQLGITGVSVSMITLEQVFLKAAEEEENVEPVDDVDGIEAPVAKNYKRLTGFALTRQMISALFNKKITYFSNNPSLFLIIILGSLFAVVFPILFKTSNFNVKDMRSLDLGLYESPEALIHSENELLGKKYKEIIEHHGGTGIFETDKASLIDGLLSRATADLTYYKSHMIISAEFNASFAASAFYSGSASYSAPITVNTMSNLVLKTVAGDQYSIVTKIGDLPRSLTQNAKNNILTRIDMITWIILFMITFFHVVSLFLKHPLMENNSKVKQLQQMAGVSSFMYWGTTFIFDFAFYIVVTVQTVFGIFVVDLIYQSNNIRCTEIGILLLLFLLFGINILLLAYIFSFIKKPFHTVYSILSGISLLLIFVLIPLHEVLKYMENAEVGNTLQRRIFSFIPHVSFVFAYMRFGEIAVDNARCRGLSNRLIEAACAIRDPCCDMNCFDGYCANPIPYFNTSRTGGGFYEFVMYLLLTPIILVGILYMLETQAFEEFANLYSKLRKNPEKSIDQDMVVDSEVAKEKSIIRQGINQRAGTPDCEDENVFLAYELSKRYGKLEAVKEVNFRVKKNECFGLLGVNGAGKSTTFRMLVGEEVPTGGILHRSCYNIKTNRTKYLEGIGYCPQSNALIPYFNAIEHLTLFARLRGIPDSEVSSEVHSWVERLNLSKHAKNPSVTYSGGNKRRLNIAIALIASPQMVLLDEPTTGVDPAARRSVWSVLQSCQASGQAIILTSHSMEECEALCNRLVIMVQGRFVCVGASQELKERFGAGFNITIKLNPGRSNDDYKEIKRKIQSALICELKDEHPGYLFYHITDSEATWLKMFETMNNVKSEHGCIEDFTVSSSTLEQLFMQFARSTDPLMESLASNRTTSNNEINRV